MLLLLIVGTFGVGLVIALAASLLDRPERRRIVSHGFWCPFRDRPVITEFEVEEWTLRRTDVRSCSAFDPPQPVVCHKRCRDHPPALPASRR